MERYRLIEDHGKACVMDDLTGRIVYEAEGASEALLEITRRKEQDEKNRMFLAFGPPFRPPRSRRPLFSEDEPICRRCDEPGSKCGCEPHGDFA